MVALRFFEGSHHSLHLVFDMFLYGLKMVLKLLFLIVLINFEGRTQMKGLWSPFSKASSGFKHPISISAFNNDCSSNVLKQ